MVLFGEKNGFKQSTNNAAGPLPLFQVYVANNETKRYQPEF